MKRRLIVIALVLVLLAVLAGVAYAATGTTDPQVLRDLAKVRRLTAKYHNVDVAIADGYAPSPVCDALPGTGAMGYHYVNFDLMMEPGVRLEAPEILLYAPSGNGVRLIGVEYFEGIGAPDMTVDQLPQPVAPAPVLFKVPFDGPMNGHIPGMPPHYDLHVWIWQPNPHGIFAMWNPSVSCEYRSTGKPDGSGRTCPATRLL